MNNPESMLDTNPFYSSHIFIFPFEWKYEKGKRPLFEDQADLSDLIALMQKATAHWKRSDSWLNPKSILQYNEANYFYEFVRPVLYDSGKKETLQCHYSREFKKPETEYVIEVDDDTTYRLELDDIVLSFYSTGVGFMAFHLLNRKVSQSSPKDILRINEFGRRLYPASYLSQRDLIGQQAFFDDATWERGLKGTQNIAKLLARSLRIETNGNAWAKDYFKQWTESPKLDSLPGLISTLLPTTFAQEISLSPVLDDRMFVLCWYGNDDLIEQMKFGANTDGYKHLDWWYEYIFVDGDGKTCQNDELFTELLQKHTNARWANYGTFYGVSRYSMVCLTETMSTNGFSKTVCSQIQTMYYKLALLCLVQRACTLRFSQEVTTISQLPKRDRKISERVGSLYKQYIRFINKIYFREVTAQEQGIELYDLLQTHMRLDTHVKELEGEIRELHNYALILEENGRSEKLDVLTYLGAFFVVPSFVVSFFSFTELKEPWQHATAFCVSSSFLAYLVISSSGRWRWVLLAISMLFIIFLLWIYPSTFQQ
jgi:Mg2+ and Co2+ transporter CorA